MELDPVFLSRLQFGFLISFHIIFPAFTIGLAAWLATIEGARLATGNALYRRVFDFWLKVFAVSFGMGVVTGIVMAFQFGTNWSVLAQKTGSIQGPLLGYETFTAFMLEATFFGVMLLGRERVSPRLLPLRLLHGLARDDVFVVLDPRQQQLDAGAARPHDRRRQDHPRGLVGHHDRTHHAGALAAHAARRLPDDRHVRGGHRGLVHPARRPSRGGPGDAQLGARSRGAADPDPALLRPLDRPLCAQAPTGEVRGNRGTLEDAAACERGADRHSR